MRRERHQSVGPAPQSFQTGILGGAWTHEHIGRVADAYRGFAATADAKAWCQMYQLQIAMRFTINAYGEAISAGLALHWCRRMEYFYGIWYEQDSNHYVYEDSDYD